MANSTRRTVLRRGCAAVASSLLALKLPHVTSAQTTSVGVFHVFAFQWKPGTSETQKERARKDIAAFQGVIPGLLQTTVGQNISPRGRGIRLAASCNSRTRPLWTRTFSIQPIKRFWRGSSRLSTQSNWTFGHECRHDTEKRALSPKSANWRLATRNLCSPSRK
jgi:hypothetical protein